jgi:peptide/nickel transport system ATP-binding protein
MMAAVIEARNLSLEYRLDKQWLNAINDVSLAIAPLEIHGLVGESGSGKSTLALALMNYLADNARVSAGAALLDGDDLTVKTAREMRDIWGSKISLVPQDALASLNPSYTIREQIGEITRRHMGLSVSASHEAAVEMLRRVQIADSTAVATSYPHQLSGGMQQRVTIAMALSTQPRLLVLDEPTTALDVTTQAVILDLFRDLIHDNKAAALYVSHDLGTVAQLCDSVTVLYGGEVMESTPVYGLYEQPLHPYTIGLLASLPHPGAGTETRLSTIEGVAPALQTRPRACVFAPRCPVALDICHTEKPLLEQARDGHMVRCHRWREIERGELDLLSVPESGAVGRPPAAEPVLQARGVSKSFDEGDMLDRLLGRARPPVRAVDDVALAVRGRSTLGLVGESGSGKTTLARCIVALTEADSGQMELCGMDLDLRLGSRSQDMLRELQMVFQNPNDALNPFRSVGQTLSRTIRKLCEKPMTDDEVQARVVELLDEVRLDPSYATRYPSELSGGEKQRVAIARAFAAGPSLVVADEPTSSLDVSVQAVILNLLKDLRAREGAAYLLISHDLDVIAYLADEIAVMYLGEIVEFGKNEAVYSAPSHPYTEALLSAIPQPDPSRRGGIIRLQGDVPSARNVPTGCRFHTRCPRKLGAICEQEAPPLRDAGDGHVIRCHIPLDDLITAQTSGAPTQEGK